MQKLYCDICKRDFGAVVNRGYQQPTYEPYQFTMGMTAADLSRGSDVCSECNAVLCEAVNDTVQKLKEKFGITS